MRTLFDERNLGAPPIKSVGFYLAAFLSLLFGCDSLSFDTWYADLNKVKADDAIVRGWIPDCIPASATKIHEWHNLDTNDCVGSFCFQPEDSEQLVSTMERIQLVDIDLRLDKRRDWPYRFRKRITGEDLDQAGFGLFKYKDFYLAVNTTAGHAYFWMN